MDYPGYDYFVTENQHDLELPLMFEGDRFRVYDMRSL